MIGKVQASNSDSIYASVEHVMNEQTDVELAKLSKIEHHLILTYYRGFIKKSFFFQQN